MRATRRRSYSASRRAYEDVARRHTPAVALMTHAYAHSTLPHARAKRRRLLVGRSSSALHEKIEEREALHGLRSAKEEKELERLVRASRRARHALLRANTSAARRGREEEGGEFLLEGARKI